MSGSRFFVLTGCSGGGKSSLLAALADMGVATVKEPGRRIVTAALAGDRQGLPWQDAAGFARRAVAMALADWHTAQALPGAVVFDRGLLDAVLAYEHATGTLPPEAEGLSARYSPLVFVTPPWEAIYQTDNARQHGFAEAVAEYQRLLQLLPRFGYRPRELPRVGVAQRAAIVRAALSA